MSLSAEDRDDLARAAEVIVGLGVVPIMGCRLCARGSACPVHVGQRVAAEQQRVVEDIVARHVAEARAAALNEAAERIDAIAAEHKAGDEAEGCESRFCGGWLLGQDHAARIVRNLAAPPPP